MEAARRFTVLVIGALVLAGCTGQGGSTKDEADDGAAGPLDEIVRAATEKSHAALAARIVEGEERIARCMGELGFEYVPSPDSYVTVAQEDIEGPRPGSREYAEQFGYGIAHSPGVVTSSGADPNQETLDALSPEAREQYEIALNGDVATWGAEPPRLEDQGCRGQGLADVWQDEPDPFGEEVRAELARIETELLPAAERVAELDARWAACMADAGYPGLTSHASASEALAEEFLAGGAGAGTVGEDGLTSAQRLFLEREIAQATADWRCRDELGYDAVAREVRAELQQEFVDAHREELDAWVAREAEAEPATG